MLRVCGFIMSTLLLALGCASGNERETICNDTYKICNNRCDKVGNTSLGGADTKGMHMRTFDCQRNCESRYTECLDRVQTWDFKVIE